MISIRRSLFDVMLLQIIGQGGPSNEVFASLWSSLASYYASESKIVFGV